MMIPFLKYKGIYEFLPIYTVWEKCEYYIDNKVEMFV